LLTKINIFFSSVITAKAQHKMRFTVF